MKRPTASCTIRTRAALHCAIPAAERASTASRWTGTPPADDRRRVRVDDIGPGSLLDDRFLLREQIGRGGMATIFKAEDLHNGGQVVAVKLPLPVFSSGVGAWSLFQQEEEIGRRLDHPFVLRFLPLPSDKRRSYVVTEYVPGRPLSAHLYERRPRSEPEAVAIAVQICAAVEHLHSRGIVHYDVKPDNIIVCPNGSIRLIDLGQLNPDVSREAEEVALRALRRNPAERYATAAAMRADLDNLDRVLVSGLAERLQPVTRWRRVRRRLRYVALVAVLPVLAQVALFGLLWRHFAHRPSRTPAPTARKAS
jgi:tRNA A-37 threonylcarbamoyl transferase component Bud32